MYFPYIRGKQFDLLALRDLIEVMSANKNLISPIIEPVKDSSTFVSTISELAIGDINFSIIINPRVGDLINNSQRIIEIIGSSLADYNNYQIGVLLGNNYDYLTQISDNSDVGASGFTLIHNQVIDNLDEVITLHDDNLPVINNVVSFQKTNRRYDRNFARETIISLEDFFNSQSKNADYLQVSESFFSEEHLYFRRDGIKGFSDYITIGENYSESGFLPWAVAIHISFVDQENKIRIKHFVSDSNDDFTDVGGKYLEALEKLITWLPDSGLSTLAIREFQELYERNHFPGLGSIKKLSIMNHIEVVIGLLQE